MTPTEITDTLTKLFNQAAVQTLAPGSWQVEMPQFRLLVLVSEDQSWLRVLVPISTVQDALPFAEQLLQANFDLTQETRYAFYQEALWGVFQHSLSGLSGPDFAAAVVRLVDLHSRGLSDYFEQLVDHRVREIIQSAKRQGQSLATTLQTLDRFYQEGLMGGLEQGAESREAVLAAWRRRLERLWPEIPEAPTG